MKRLLTTSASAIVLAGAIAAQANAADVIVEQDPVPPEAPIIAGVNWTGFHFGAGVGYGASTQTGTIELYDYSPGGLFQFGLGEPLFDLYSIGLSTDAGGEGAIGTVEGGYDLQLGPNWVVGISGDYTWSEMGAETSIFGDVCYEFPLTGTSGADDDCSNNVVSDRPDITYTLNTGDSWSVIGRAGYLFTPTTLIYGLGGYTHTSMDADLTLDSGPTGSQEFLSYEYSREGWTYGAGVETFIANDVTLKMEYRATSWDESRDIPFGAEQGIRFEDEGLVQTFRGVLSWRPGAGGGDHMAASTNGSYDTAMADWTGFHIGAGGGYGASQQTGAVELFDYDLGGLIQIGPFDLYSIGASNDFGGDGWIGTVEGGYDYQLGSNWVVGVSGDFTWSGVESETSIFGDVCYENAISGQSPDDCDNNVVSDTPDLTYTWSTGDSWSVIGRVGYLATPKTLVYGLGGYTHTDMEIDLAINSDPANIQLFNNSYDRDGWTWGAGIETMIASNWSAKLEYRNTQWDESFTIPLDEEAGITFSDDGMVQSFRALLSWRM